MRSRLRPRGGQESGPEQCGPELGRGVHDGRGPRDDLAVAHAATERAHRAVGERAIRLVAMITDDGLRESLDV